MGRCKRHDVSFRSYDVLTSFQCTEGQALSVNILVTEWQDFHRLSCT